MKLSSQVSSQDLAEETTPSKSNSGEYRVNLMIPSKGDSQSPPTEVHRLTQYEGIELAPLDSGNAFVAIKSYKFAPDPLLSLSAHPEVHVVQVHKEDVHDVPTESYLYDSNSSEKAKSDIEGNSIHSFLLKLPRANPIDIVLEHRKQEAALNEEDRCPPVEFEEVVQELNPNRPGLKVRKAHRKAPPELKGKPPVCLGKDLEDILQIREESLSTLGDRIAPQFDRQMAHLSLVIGPLQVICHIVLIMFSLYYESKPSFIVHLFFHILCKVAYWSVYDSLIKVSVGSGLATLFFWFSKIFSFIQQFVHLQRFKVRKKRPHRTYQRFFHRKYKRNLVVKCLQHLKHSFQEVLGLVPNNIFSSPNALKKWLELSEIHNLRGKAVSQEEVKSTWGRPISIFTARVKPCQPDKDLPTFTIQRDSIAGRTPVWLPIFNYGGLPYLKGTIYDRESLFLLDSGCGINLVPRSLVEESQSKSGIPFEKFEHRHKLLSHGGNTLPLLPHGVILPLMLQDTKGNHRQHLVPFLVEDADNSTPILGFRTILAMRLSFDFKNRSLKVKCTPNTFCPTVPTNLQVFSTTCSSTSLTYRHSNAILEISGKVLTHMDFPVPLHFTPHEPVHEDNCQSIHLHHLPCGESPDVQILQSTQGKVTARQPTNHALNMLVTRLHEDGTPLEVSQEKTFNLKVNLNSDEVISLGDPETLVGLPLVQLSLLTPVEKVTKYGLHRGVREDKSPYSHRYKKVKNIYLNNLNKERLISAKDNKEDPKKEVTERGNCSAKQVFVSELDIRVPAGLVVAAEFTPDPSLERSVESAKIDPCSVRSIESVKTFKSIRVPAGLVVAAEFTPDPSLERSVESAQKDPSLERSVESTKKDPSLERSVESAKMNPCSVRSVPDLCPMKESVESAMESESINDTAKVAAFLRDQESLDPQEKQPRISEYKRTTHTSSQGRSHEENLSFNCEWEAPLNTQNSETDVLSYCIEAVNHVDEEPGNDDKTWAPTVEIVAKAPGNLPVLEIIIVNKKNKCLLCAEPCLCHIHLEKHSETTCIEDMYTTRVHKKEIIIHKLDVVLLEEASQMVLYSMHQMTLFLIQKLGKQVIQFPQNILERGGENLKQQLLSHIIGTHTLKPGVTYFLLEGNKMTQEKETKMHKITETESLPFKGEEYRCAHTGVPPSVTEPTGLEFYSAPTKEEDFTKMLENSLPEMKNFLQQLFKTFTQVYSSDTNRIGRLLDERHKLELTLEDEKARLPQHMPYPTGLIARRAADRIIQSWEDSGLVEKSTTNTHASRLCIARKHLSQRDREQIATRLASQNIKIDPNQESCVHQVDPDLLNIGEINKSWRLCLDGRDLNILTKPVTPVAQVPDQMIWDLQCLIHEDSLKKLINHTQESLRATKKDQMYLPHHPELQPEPRELETLYQEIENMKVTTKNQGERLYFSSIDLKSAHNSVPLGPEAKRLLNFITPSLRLYRFCQAPYGLTNISSVFNRSLIEILGDLVSRGLLILYADDIVICVRSKRAHALVLAEVLRRLQENGVLISINKCSFFTQHFTFLGHKFNQGGVEMTQERINSILLFPQPRSIKEVQRYLGTLGYVQRFMPYLQLTLSPIHELLKKDVVFQWTSEASEAFETIQHQLRNQIKLRPIPPTGSLTVFTDASGKGSGMTVFAGDPGTEGYGPVLFSSRKFSLQQQKSLTSLEKEILGLLDALAKLRYFVTEGRPITVVTDAKSILWLIKSSKESQNGRLNRLALKLREINPSFKIEYSKPNTTEMLLTDLLSRMHIKEENSQLLQVKRLRQINPKDIKHTLSGTYTYDDLIEILEENPGIVPLPEATAEETTPSSNFQNELNLHHLLTAEQEPDIAELIEAQQEDPALAEICQYFVLRRPQKPEVYRHHTSKEGILFKVKDDNITPGALNCLVAIPQRLLPEYLARIHINNGHLGLARLMTIFQSQFYNPTASKIATKLLRGCLLCEAYKVSSYRRAPLTGFHEASRPLQIVACDFFAMPKDKGYEKIFVIVDHFSGHVQAYKVKNESTSQVIQCLNQYIHSFGTFESIKSDNAKSLLKNKMVKAFLKEHGITRLILSLPYSATHNPYAERIIRSLRRVLHAATQGTRKWTEALVPSVMVLNNLPRNRGNVQVSPHTLFFGREPHPLYISPSLIYSNLDPPKSREKYEKLQEQVRAYLKDSHEKYMEDFNQKARKLPFTEESFVFLRDLRPAVFGQLPNQKYRPAYHKKPFLVKKIQGPLVVLECILTGKINLVHSKYLKRADLRDETFKLLSPEVQNVMGKPVGITSGTNSRRKVIDELRKAGYFKDEIGEEILYEETRYRIDSEGSLLPPKTTKRKQSSKEKSEPLKVHKQASEEIGTSVPSNLEEEQDIINKDREALSAQLQDAFHFTPPPTEPSRARKVLQNIIRLARTRGTTQS